MTALTWVLPIAALASLGWLLALLSAAGRRYLRGEIEEAGRRSRPLGILALAASLVALPSGASLVDEVPRPVLLAGSLALFALAGLAACLGGVARKPVPAVYLAWTAYAAAIVSAAAALVRAS